MHGMNLAIPPADDLRADIRARTADLRALRKLLRHAEAARRAREGVTTQNHNALRRGGPTSAV
jgi:hypothetical protein